MKAPERTFDRPRGRKRVRANVSIDPDITNDRPGGEIKWKGEVPPNKQGVNP
jgi:hypothetical protein